LPLTDWMGSTTTATARWLRASKLCVRGVRWGGEGGLGGGKGGGGRGRFGDRQGGEGGPGRPGRRGGRGVAVGSAARAARMGRGGCRTAARTCCVLMSVPDSQQPKPGWLWYQPTTISGLTGGKGGGGGRRRGVWATRGDRRGSQHGTLQPPCVRRPRPPQAAAGRPPPAGQAGSVPAAGPRPAAPAAGPALAAPPPTPADLLEHVKHLGLEHRVHRLHADASAGLRHGKHVHHAHGVVVHKLAQHQAHDLHGHAGAACKAGWGGVGTPPPLGGLGWPRAAAQRAQLAAPTDG
jgi:hypothetical protein